MLTLSEVILLHIRFRKWSYSHSYAEKEVKESKTKPGASLVAPAELIIPSLGPRPETDSKKDPPLPTNIYVIMLSILDLSAFMFNSHAGLDYLHHSQRSDSFWCSYWLIFCRSEFSQTRLGRRSSQIRCTWLIAVVLRTISSPAPETRPNSRERFPVSCKPSSCSSHDLNHAHVAILRNCF